MKTYLVLALGLVVLSACSSNPKTTNEEGTATRAPTQVFGEAAVQMQIGTTLHLNRVKKQGRNGVYELKKTHTPSQDDNSKAFNVDPTECTIKTNLDQDRYGQPTSFSLRPQTVWADLSSDSIRFQDSASDLTFEVRCVKVLADSATGKPMEAKIVPSANVLDVLFNGRIQVLRTSLDVDR